MRQLHMGTSDELMQLMLPMLPPPLLPLPLPQLQLLPLPMSPLLLLPSPALLLQVPATHSLW